MARIIIESKEAETEKKAAGPKKGPATEPLVVVVLLLAALALIAGIVLAGLNIKKRSQKMTLHRLEQPQPEGAAVPGLSPPMALPGLSGGGAPSAAPTPVAPTAPVHSKDMVLIPAGEYLSNRQTAGQPVKSYLPAFFIDRTEVTNRQYYEFVSATGHQAPRSPRGRAYDIWHNGSYPPDLADHPVVYLSYQDAEEYARWRGCRLPTEAEWEKAAGGPSGFTYPWGNQFEPSYANCRDNPSATGTTAPVDSFPSDRSPYGVVGMAGNVREWTSTPYSAGNKFWKVVKGGGFRDGQSDIVITNRFKGTTPDADLGFRCVRDSQ